MTPSFEIYTYMLLIGAYVTRSIYQQRSEKGLCKLHSSYSIFQEAQATYGNLLDQGGCSQSDQILRTAIEKRGFAISDELLKCFKQFSVFGTKQTTVL